MTPESTPPDRPKPPILRTRPPGTRLHLTPAEVERLAVAAGSLGRHPRRDALMVRMAFRHGLRVAELVSLRREQLDLEGRLIHVRRVKQGTPSTHPLGSAEIRSLRKLLKEYPTSAYIFPNERGGPLGTRAVGMMMDRAGKAAHLPIRVHPHMLRHACGYKLANEGKDTRAIQHYLGHVNIQHTVTYTDMSPDRFRDWWRD